jgi:hypothetical protein
MPLDVKFTVKSTNLRFQEDSLAEAVLTNTGRDPLLIANPIMAPELLRLKVVNIKTGVETVFQRKKKGGSMPSIERPLGPGKAYEHDLMLLDLPGELDPGEYDVTLGCTYNKGADSAESAPVRVKIRGTTPRNLGIEGTAKKVFFGAWVNLGEDGPEIVRMRFDVVKGGGARDLRPLAKSTHNVRPVVSTPPNGQASAHTYVAWVDGAEIKFLQLHETDGLSPVRSISLPGGESRIVGPLHSDPTPDTDARPDGGLLLWMGEKDKAESQLQSLKLSESGAKPQARVPLPGPKPVQLGSFVRADGRRMALIVQAAGGKFTVSVIPWPGMAGALKKLGEWKGEFLSLGYAMDGGDVLHGSMFFRTGIEPHDDLDRIDFDLDGKDGFTAKAPVRITIDPQDPVEHALVRVSDQGGIAALLKGPAGWSIYDGQSPAAAPLAEPLKSSNYPLDLGFLNDSTPIVIAARKDFGFHLHMADGSPIPPNPV